MPAALPADSPANRRAIPVALLLAVLCSACGPGGPKPKTDDGAGAGAGAGGNDGAGIALVAGDPVQAGSADRKGNAARFDTPRGIAVDAGGNLYVADERNFAIRKIDPNGQVSTFAGASGAAGSADGKGARARFARPTALAIDGAGNLFVTDAGVIRKITPAGEVSTTTTVFANNGFGIPNAAQPGGIAVDGSGRLFVTTGGDTRRYVSTSRFDSLESGLPSVVPFGADALAPRGVAVDPNGNAYYADLRNRIVRVAPGGAVATAFAGLADQSGAADGNATTVRFRLPIALAAAADGNLYVADAVSNTVRKVTANAVTSTVAGVAGGTLLRTGGLPGSLADVRGIAADGKGKLYVTSGNAVVRITLP